MLITCMLIESQGQVYPTKFKKISRTSGGLTTPINTGAVFGILCAAIGDLDDDGVTDIAVGATNQGGADRGSVFILFLNRDGTVKGSREILPLESNQNDSFGSSIVALGDMNGDGIEDIGVGANYDGDGGGTSGSLWILFMEKNGTVKGSQKISATQGNFTQPLTGSSTFGTGATNLGDLDNDGVIDLAVGSFGHGQIDGAVYILFMNSNGTVKSSRKITQGTAGISFDNDGYFGYGLSALGDVDGDGVTDLGVGAHRTDDGGVDRGAVWVIFLTSTGSVKGFNKISATSGSFTQSTGRLGVSIAGIGDYDSDGVPDMIVGGNDASGSGAIFYLMLNNNGTVKSSYKISSSSGNNDLVLKSNDYFGGSIAFLGTDINNDGIKDIAIGAFLDDDGGTDSGAIWITAGCQTPTSDAGTNQNVCSGNQVILQAGNPAIGTGTWSVLQGAGIFANSHNPISQVNNPAKGINKFVWTVMNFSCSATDTVTVEVLEMPKAKAGINQNVCITDPVILGAESPSLGIGTWSVLQGAGSFINLHDSESQVNNTEIGINKYLWTVINLTCSMSDTVTITAFGKLKETDFPNVITPNGDLKNDVWIINNINDAPDNNIRVYNRWGLLVFNASNYKNDWGGDHLSPGTYFYYFSDGCKTDIKGSLLITH
ncbi:MAG: T9SS type B sorting domain-containing protein [Cyclobacteriaceae bacterium]|nr:T9SS type B sorting domain-containing protein [Cyclobacteriaceae bacterium]